MISFSIISKRSEILLFSMLLHDFHEDLYNSLNLRIEGDYRLVVNNYMLGVSSPSISSILI